MDLNASSVQPQLLKTIFVHPVNWVAETKQNKSTLNLELELHQIFPLCWQLKQPSRWRVHATKNWSKVIDWVFLTKTTKIWWYKNNDSDIWKNSDKNNFKIWMIPCFKLILINLVNPIMAEEVNLQLPSPPQHNLCFFSPYQIKIMTPNLVTFDKFLTLTWDVVLPGFTFRDPWLTISSYKVRPCFPWHLKSYLCYNLQSW